MKNTQNFKNHSRIDLGFHGLLFLLILGGLIGSLINLTNSLENDSLYSASLLSLLFLILIIMYVYVRLFPLRVQDRAIRAEENLRHYVLSGTPLPSRLNLDQIIALRFASDEEFLKLTERAANENLTAKEIKLSVKSWRADYHRA